MIAAILIIASRMAVAADGALGATSTGTVGLRVIVANSVTAVGSIAAPSAPVGATLTARRGGICVYNNMSHAHDITASLSPARGNGVRVKLNPMVVGAGEGRDGPPICRGGSALSLNVAGAAAAAGARALLLTVVPR